MIHGLRRAAKRVSNTIKESRQRGGGFKSLCEALEVDPAELDQFVTDEVASLNGDATVDGAMMRGLLTGLALAQEIAQQGSAAADGIDWAAVGKVLPPHKTRTAIMVYLRDHRVGSPNGMATATGEMLGNVSYHTRVLLEATTPLVELVGTEPRRGAVEHFYALTDAARGEAAKNAA